MLPNPLRDLPWATVPPNQRDPYRWDTPYPSARSIFSHITQPLEGPGQVWVPLGSGYIWEEKVGAQSQWLLLIPIPQQFL